MTVALVTGITGFLGRHLARILRSRRVTVVGTSRTSRSAPDADRVLVGDITDRAFAAEAVQELRPSLIFHLAANKRRTGGFADFRRSLEDNLFGTLNLIESCVDQPRIERFIAIGTCEEYGRANAPFKEVLRESPVTAYSFSKASATHLLQTLHRLHGVPAVVLRPSLAYGPEQGHDMFLPDLIRTLLSRKRFAMSAGDQTRDYVYIDDLIEAILLAAARPEAIGQVINVSSGVPILLKDLARLAARKIGPDAETLLDVGSKSYRPNEIMEYVASHDLAEELLGWRPHTSLDEGLGTTVEYFRARVAAG